MVEERLRHVLSLVQAQHERFDALGKPAERPEPPAHLAGRQPGHHRRLLRPPRSAPPSRASSCRHPARCRCRSGGPSGSCSVTHTTSIWLNCVSASSSSAIGSWRRLRGRARTGSCLHACPGCGEGHRSDRADRCQATRVDLILDEQVDGDEDPKEHPLPLDVPLRDLAQEDRLLAPLREVDRGAARPLRSRWRNGFQPAWQHYANPKSGSRPASSSMSQTMSAIFAVPHAVARQHAEPVLDVLPVVAHGPVPAVGHDAARLARR